MRKTVFAIVTPIVLVAGAAVMLAAAEPASKPQTACPVTGKAVDKNIHVDFQGQRIYFCSAACPAEFRKDSEAYFAKIAEAGVELENIQTTCPVSGEELEGGDMGGPVSHAYKGRTVMFCCKMCVGKFDKDPARYLAKLPGEQPPTAK
jgi:YHS domain-containing protein